MTHEPTNAEHLFRELLGVIPEFAPRYDAHLEDNDELLPYVLMDDFSRFVVESQSSGDHDVFKPALFTTRFFKVLRAAGIAGWGLAS